ncbi:hypothetical protein SCLCIDRAFT_114706 [Scleroderma citrinum Foug A]|uniref:Uncharacterized protein n=1 Tax=Scleroderma citrinum Foug A TaxID=1036808 RepID=A0A0C3E9H5_9AGAM|nr:hypothetical protein SCLCIDRAFT_114706 [Scleroderma citrinum Foug A]
MNQTKITQLQGLEKNVLPLVPLERTFSIYTSGGNKKTVHRRQLPLTPAYSFTDYRSQGQTIQNIIIDIRNPPSGTLTPFNIYVALSQARGRDQIRLLRDFDDKLLTKHPSEYLRLEDERLGNLERKSDEWWQRILSELSE